jgi:hypothetical protein
VVKETSPSPVTMCRRDSSGAGGGYVPTAVEYRMGGYEIEITPHAPEAASVIIVTGGFGRHRRQKFSGTEATSRSVGPIGIRNAAAANIPDSETANPPGGFVPYRPSRLWDIADSTGACHELQLLVPI